MVIVKKNKHIVSFFLIPERTQKIDNLNVDDFFTPFLEIDMVVNKLEIIDEKAFALAVLEKKLNIEYEYFLYCLYYSTNNISIINNIKIDEDDYKINYEDIKFFNDIPNNIIEDFLADKKIYNTSKKFFITEIEKVEEKADNIDEASKVQQLVSDNSDNKETTNSENYNIDFKTILANEAQKRDEAYILLGFLIDEEKDEIKKSKNNMLKPNLNKEILFEKIIFSQEKNNLGYKEIFVVNKEIDQLSENEIDYEIEISVA